MKKNKHKLLKKWNKLDKSKQKEDIQTKQKIDWKEPK